MLGTTSTSKRVRYPITKPHTETRMNEKFWLIKLVTRKLNGCCSIHKKNLSPVSKCASQDHTVFADIK